MMDNFKTSIRILALSITVSLFFNSCKNDLEINADYDAQAIVYAVLNPYDSVQTFRISKTFLGSGNPTDYAKVADSTYFSKVNLVLSEVVNGSVVRKWDLVEKTINNKKGGSFFGPDQKIYVVKPEKAPEDPFYLNPLAEFTLTGTVDDKSISSKTKIVQEEKTLAFFLNGANKFDRFRSRGDLTMVNGSQVNDLTLNVTFPKGTKVASLALLFNYEELYSDNRVVQKQIEYNLGEQVIEDVNDQKELKFVLEGERFFERIGAENEDVNDVPGLVKRIPGAIDFKMIAATEDLFYYRQVNNIGSDVVQDKPEYTNIENGYGILAGRQIITFNEQLRAHGINGAEVILSKFSQQELATGTRLGHTPQTKGFCIDASHKLEPRCE